MANVCVFNDMKLGGVLREYIEVFSPSNGEVKKDWKPTNIVHIESDDSPGVRYELVDRKAEVGDRILVTKKTARNMRDMSVGKVYDVISGPFVGGDEDYVEVIDDVGDQASAFDDSYYVVVPVENEVTESSPKSNDETGVLDIIANLVARVAELERREEAQRRLNGVISQRIAALSQRIDSTHRDVETWAQEVEKVRAELGDKIEMCIDDIVTLNERTGSQEITISVADLAKLIGGVR